MPTRDDVRAALIAVHLLVIGLAAIPTPDGRLTDRNLRDPDVQETLRQWAPLGRAVGVARTDDEFVAWLWDLGKGIVTVRQAVMAPVTPYLAYTGQDQAWRMFGTVNRHVGYLQVHAGRDGAWEPLYDEHVAEPWGSLLLDQERVRALRAPWGMKHGRKDYELFASWLAVRAAADHPEATAIRVRYQAAVIGTPAEVRAAGGLLRGDVYWEQVYDVVPP